MQKVIGPSEIGSECDRCLGHKLAGTPKRQDADWQPYVGVAVHAQLERIFLANPASRWVSEERVMVGHIDGAEIWGTCDLFDHTELCVVDFKTASKTQLQSAKANGPSRQYQIQAHLYGRGWQLYGFTPRTVSLCFLPRDGMLHQTFWWSEPYDEQIAVAALKRADALAQAIRIIGADTILPTLQRATDKCWDCERGRYPTYPTDPPVQVSGPFADLAQQTQQHQLEGATA
jgi:hypothetical protein